MHTTQRSPSSCVVLCCVARGEKKEDASERTIGWQIRVIERPLSNSIELTDAISLVRIERRKAREKYEGRTNRLSFIGPKQQLTSILLFSPLVSLIGLLSSAPRRRTPSHILAFSLSLSLQLHSTASDDELNDRVCRVLVFPFDPEAFSVRSCSIFPRIDPRKENKANSPPYQFLPHFVVRSKHSSSSFFSFSLLRHDD